MIPRPLWHLIVIGAFWPPVPATIVAIILTIILTGPVNATGPAFSCCQKQMTEQERKFCDSNPDLDDWCKPAPKRRVTK